jgi:hypothetical protein
MSTKTQKGGRQQASFEDLLTPAIGRSPHDQRLFFTSELTKCPINKWYLALCHHELDLSISIALRFHGIQRVLDVLSKLNGFPGDVYGLHAPGVPAKHISLLANL